MLWFLGGVLFGKFVLNSWAAGLILGVVLAFVT